jgi:DNA-binding MarR family transcriptional regulator
MTSTDADANTIFQFFVEIAIINQLSTHQFEQVMPFGMSMAHFGVLNHLYRVGGSQAPTEIARAMQVTRGKMKVTLGALMRAGFISVSQDESDRRSKLIAISQSGHVARRCAIQALEPALRCYASLFPMDVLDDVTRILETIRKTLDQLRE